METCFDIMCGGGPAKQRWLELGHPAARSNVALCHGAEIALISQLREIKSLCCLETLAQFCCQDFDIVGLFCQAMQLAPQ